MEYKTKIKAEKGKQDILITREFALPVELVFEAYTDAEIVEQWMGTHVLKLENKKHGSYQFVTTDPRGFEHRFNGAIHEIIMNQKITRTFEMENTPFPVQLEFLTFDKIDNDNSMLQMHIIYKSVEDRDAMLKLPFAQGISMAHDRIQNIVQNLKK
jgi:uncharacterized protein YndB with AHSA1/START domain